MNDQPPDVPLNEYENGIFALVVTLINQMKNNGYTHGQAVQYAIGVLEAFANGLRNMDIKGE